MPYRPGHATSRCRGPGGRCTAGAGHAAGPTGPAPPKASVPRSEVCESLQLCGNSCDFSSSKADVIGFNPRNSRCTRPFSGVVSPFRGPGPLCLLPALQDRRRRPGVTQRGPGVCAFQQLECSFARGQIQMPLASFAQLQLTKQTLQLTKQTSQNPATGISTGTRPNTNQRQGCPVEFPAGKVSQQPCEFDFVCKDRQAHLFSKHALASVDNPLHECWNVKHGHSAHYMKLRVQHCVGHYIEQCAHHVLTQGCLGYLHQYISNTILSC